MIKKNNQEHRYQKSEVSFMKVLENDWSICITDTWETDGIEYCIGHDEHDNTIFFAGTITTFKDKQVLRFKYEEKPERSMVEKDCKDYLLQKEFERIETEE